MYSIKWTDVVSAVVVVYAAFLSTYNLIESLKAKRPRVNLELSNGFFAVPGRAESKLLINVSNPGERQVSVREVGLRLSDGRKLIMPEQQGSVQLPFTLAVGGGEVFYFDPHVISTSLSASGRVGTVRLRAYCREAVGRHFYR
jgi:hypothetical protein